MDAHLKPKSRPVVMLAAGLLALALNAGCATKGHNKGDYNLLSYEDESRLGGQLKDDVDAQLAAEGMSYRDAEVSAYVDRIGRRLLAHAPEVKFSYTFTVVKSEVVNAFSLPGGHIYVNTGLIAASDNEAELAGVIAHEIGHVVARHGSERLSAALTAALVGDILIASQGPAADRVLTDLAVQIATQTGGLAYSRTQENESDEIAVQIMYDAGYDPRALQRFFQKLRDEHGDESKAQVFFSSHPDPKDRRGKVRDLIEQLPPRDDLILDTPEFDAMREKCKNLHPGK